jgi:hypothetical protein
LGEFDQLIFRQQRARPGDDPSPRSRFIGDTTEEENAPADTDRHDVEAYRDTGPEVDLKDRLPQPNALRTPHELFHESQ